MRGDARQEPTIDGEDAVPPEAAVNGPPTVPYEAAEMLRDVPQGRWTVDDFFLLDQRTNRPIELVDGFLEFPTGWSPSEGRWRFWLRERLAGHPSIPEGASVHSAPMPVPTVGENHREPDVFVVTEVTQRPTGTYPGAVGWVAEIVSPDADSRRRDLVTKRREYAAAGIPEYWIVDPEARTVTVLTLPAGAGEYAEHGVFGEGDTASGRVLEGFGFPVSDLFAAA